MELYRFVVVDVDVSNEESMSGLLRGGLLSPARENARGMREDAPRC